MITFLFINKVPSILLSLLAVLLVFSLLVVIIKFKSKYPLVILTICIILFSICWHSIYSYFYINNTKKYLDKNINVNAQVLQINESYIQIFSSVELKITSINNKKIVPFKVISDNFVEAKIGDTINTTLVLQEFDNPIIKKIRLADNILYDAQHQNLQQTVLKCNKILYFFSELNNKATQRIEKLLEPQNASILSAMVTGNKDSITKQTQMFFSISGLSHILVVSGLHLGVIALLINYAFSNIFKNQKLSSAITFIPIIFYLLFVGFSPSIIRAAFLVGIMLLANIISKQSDSLTSIGFALVFLLISNPYCCFDVGLMFSFCVSIGIIISQSYLSKIQEKDTLKFRYKVLVLFYIPIVSLVSSLFVQLYIDGSVSLLGVIANAFVVIFLPFILILGFVLLLVSSIPVLNFITIILVEILNFVLLLLIKITEVVSEFSFSNVVISGEFTFVVLILAFLFLFIFCYNKKFKKAIISFSTIIIFSVIVFNIFNYNSVKITPVGNYKKPSLVITQNLSATIIFRGDEASILALHEYLLRNNIRKINKIIILDNSDSQLMLANSFECDTIEEITDNQLVNKYDISQDITIYTEKLDDSKIALIDVSGYTVLISNASTDVGHIGKVNTYISSSSTVLNLKCDNVISLSEKPKWITNDMYQNIYLWQNKGYIWVRPEKSAKINVKDD